MIKNIFFLIIIVLGLVSCTSDNKTQEEDILVRVGEQKLGFLEVRKLIPAGLSKSDSMLLVNSIIKNWIDSKLMSEVAAKNIVDPGKIESMVGEYRDQLIMQEYRKGMILKNTSITEIPEDSLRTYYENNKNKFRLDRPIVKGLFIKISSDSRNISNLKKWYKSGKHEDIDKIEKSGLNGAIGYDYFNDRWVSWTDVEKSIPHYFENPDQFLKTNKNFELTEKGFVYLLNITDYKHTGDIMPYDFARKQIKEMFVNENQRKYDAQLKQMLYDEAVKSGDLEIYYNQKK